VEVTALRHESGSEATASEERAGSDERTEPRALGGGAPPPSLGGTTGDSIRQPAAISRHAESHGTVARNAFYLVVGQVVTTALAIVLSAAMGRSLGATDFGLYYLISTMSTFAYVFVEWGQPIFVIRQVARDPFRSGDLLGTGLAIRVVLAVAVLAPAGLIAWLLGYGARTVWLSLLLILASLPLFLAQGYGMVFRASDRMGRDATVSVSNKIIVLCVALPALALGAGIPGVIFAQAVAGVAALAVAVRLHRRLGAPRLRVSSETARDLLVAGAPLLAMMAAVQVQPYLDAIILSKLVPGTVVGWFGAARSILNSLMAPAAILGAAAYPRIARVSADAAALRQEVRSAFRPLLWLGALAGTGTYLFADTAIRLIYGARGFGPSATILQVFAPGLVLIFIDILLGNVIYASGRGTWFAAAKIMSVVVGSVLDLLLIPYFQEHFGNGGIGVFVAFGLSEFVVLGGALIVLRQGTLTGATALDFARALGAAATTLLLFRLTPALPPWVGIPLCVAVFAVASMALGLMGGGDLAELRMLVRRPTVAAPPAGPTDL
jgi:O-antigen/teichoic acid export membrane protein